jgi:hypothetical protein
LHREGNPDLDKYGWITTTFRGGQIDLGEEICGRDVFPADDQADVERELVYEKVELGGRRGQVADLGYGRRG